MATGKASLDPNFKEFLRSLNSAGVRYLVLGGYAVNYYGYHRTTGDLDIWIATDAANAEKVSQVMQGFGGFPARTVRPSVFRQMGKIFQFGRVPLRIDLLTDPSGVSFDDCYARRHVGKLDDVEVPFISIEDLKANKRSSGRTKDLADLEHLPQDIGPAKPRRRLRKKP